MNDLQVTRCHNAETGQYADIATDALATGAWQKLGWEPVSESQSLEELHNAKVTAEYEAAAEAATAAAEAEALAEDVDAHTVAEVLEEVGDDPVKAQAALDAENATGTPRKTLIAALSKVLEAAPDPAAVGDGATEAGQPGHPEGN